MVEQYRDRSRETGRTSLGRASQAPRVTGVALQGETLARRSYVEPWAGSSAPSAESTGASPMARMSAQQLGQDHDRAQIAEQGASPPPAQLDVMAEQVFSMIMGRIAEERDRYGR